MNALRARMIEDLQLHGLAKNTQARYVEAVRHLAEFYHKPPDQITEEELRQYFLHLSNVKRVSASTLGVALYGIKFFYEQTLHQPRTVLDLVRPPRDQKLPVVLTVEEVRQILGCVNFLRYRACLGTIYTCTHRRCGVPVGCAFKRGFTYKSKISMQHGVSSTFATAKGARTVTCLCLHPFSKYCAAIG